MSESNYSSARQGANEDEATFAAEIELLTEICLLYTSTKLRTNAELVLERQTEVEAYALPKWAKLITAGIDAVSYTHLDVYKRQAPWRNWKGRWRCNAGNRPHDIEIGRASV